MVFLLVIVDLAGDAAEACTDSAGEAGTYGWVKNGSTGGADGV